MKKALISLIALGTLIAAPVAMAGTKTGDMELSGSVLYMSMDNFNYTTVNGGLSYFVTDSFSLGGSVTFSGSDDVDATFYIEPNYHFNTSEIFIPYIGVHGSYYVPSADVDSDMSYGAQAGLKAFFDERAALKLEGKQGFGDRDITTLTIGITVYF